MGLLDRLLGREKTTVTYQPESLTRCRTFKGGGVARRLVIS